MSRNPYKGDNQKPELRNSVSAYIDILGYQNQIKSSTGPIEQQNLLNRLHEVLSFSRKWLDGGFLSPPLREFGDKDLFSLRAFSDNIAIGWPISDDGENELDLAFDNLAFFQLEMVNEGFFVRGAISIGSMYLDDVVVFGDALLEAYEGESSLARDPRIILTKSACEYVRWHLSNYHDKDHAPQARAILEDTDGQWFLNYLEIFRSYLDDVPIFFQELEKHKVSVESKLGEYRHKPNIFSKCAWVAGYHNHFCETHNFHDHMINIESFAGELGYIIKDT